MRFTSTLRFAGGEKWVIGDGTRKDLDLLREVACSMGSMPGTTIVSLLPNTRTSLRARSASQRLHRRTERIVADITLR